jgi:cell division protein ZapA
LLFAAPAAIDKKVLTLAWEVVMTVVPVFINGKEYQLACDPGQEEHLVGLSQEVDDRVRLLARQIPQASENMLLLMVSIMLADELSDSKRVARRLQGQLHRMEEMLDNSQVVNDQARLAEMESAMAATLQDVAIRIEKIAEQLELTA